MKCLSIRNVIYPVSAITSVGMSYEEGAGWDVWISTTDGSRVMIANVEGWSAAREARDGICQKLGFDLPWELR